jgi:hypothetical protein
MGLLILITKPQGENRFGLTFSRPALYCKVAIVIDRLDPRRADTFLWVDEMSRSLARFSFYYATGLTCDAHRGHGCSQSFQRLAPIAGQVSELDENKNVSLALHDMYLVPSKHSF